MAQPICTMPGMDTLTDQIRADMRRQGITQTALAARLGVTPQAISKALAAPALSDTRARIVAALGGQVAYIPSTRPGEPSESDSPTP